MLRTKQSIPEPPNKIVPALMLFWLGISLVVHHNRAVPSVQDSRTKRLDPTDCRAFIPKRADFRFEIYVTPLLTGDS